MANLFAHFAQPIFEDYINNGPEPTESKNLELTVKQGVLGIEMAVVCSQNYSMVDRKFHYIYFFLPSCTVWMV